MSEPGRQDGPPLTGAAGADRDASHAARGAFLQLLSIIGQGLLPVFQMLVARLFGMATFGAYRASAAIVEVLVRAGLVGSAHGQYRFVAGHRAVGEDDLALRALGTGLVIAGTVSTVLAIGLAVFAPLVAQAWHEPGLRVALPIIAPAIPLTVLTLVLMAATLGAKVARMNLYVRGIAEPALLFTAAIVAWRLSGSLRGIAAAHLAATLVTTLLAVAACARVFGWLALGRAVTGPRHPTFLSFAAPLGAADLMNALLQRIDVFVVLTFAGVDALAVYSAAEFLARIVVNPRLVFDPIIAPVVAEALQARDPERARYNLALTTRWVIALSAPIAVTLIVLRVEVLSLYGASFTTGAPALIILAGAHMVNGCLGLTPYVIAMGGRSKLFFIDNLGAALINLGLGVLLVPRLGIVGAAISALVSVTVLQLAIAVQAWVLERVHPFAPAQLKPLAAAAVAMVAERFVHSLSLPLPARVAAVIGTGLVVYLGALAALGLGREERQFFAKLARRLRGERP